ncbi:hypothetical protein LJC08_00095 [Methanimicrococcus sp. OttesenSCG-928-J09]|nr:hypothetical protein [Methanimicrococcus sp. OttesenSCG-928-J09]
MFVAGWSQGLVLQWEGDLHLKSLRDFCGCRRSKDIFDSAADSTRASRIIFSKLNKTNL